MKSPILKRVAALGLLAALAAPLSVTAQDAPKQTHYIVIDLGTLGGANGGANSINNRGWVTGATTVAGEQNTHAALWINGEKTDLGTLPGGGNSAIAWPVKNEHGFLVGISETGQLDPNGERFSCPSFFLGVPLTHQSCQGFLWHDGAMTPLPTLGGNNSYATALNNRGQAVGWAENTVHDPTCVHPRQVLQFHAVIWDKKGDITELLPLGSDTSSAATAINDDGAVVGISGICDRAVGRFSAAHAVLWKDGTVTDLGNLGGVAWNTPAAINHKGDIAGFMDLPGDASGVPNFHAFLWTAGSSKPQDLKTIDTDVVSGAFGMNDRGQIVGQSIDSDGFSRAFIYENGVMTDLNSMVPAGSPFLVYANDINERGEVAGQACVVVDHNCVTTSAFLAIPVHGDDAGWAGNGNAQKARLPESLRRQLEQRFGLGFLEGIPASQ